jgi:site-specific recombinase XerD
LDKALSYNKTKKEGTLTTFRESNRSTSRFKETYKVDSPYLFPGKIDGKPLQDVRGFWQKMLKEANLETIRIHDLRHTHASHLVSSGLSLSIVGKLLGHTQASTTQRYAHLADAPLRQAVELFGSKVGIQPKGEEK